jgi:chemotaxis protein MotB
LSFKGRTDYDNYDLSTDRAKAARRAMIEGGMDGNNFSQITGKAATALIVEPGVTPYSHKQRRIVVEIEAAA